MKKLHMIKFPYAKNKKYRHEIYYCREDKFKYLFNRKQKALGYFGKKWRKNW